MLHTAVSLIQRVLHKIVAKMTSRIYCHTQARLQSMTKLQNHSFFRLLWKTAGRVFKHSDPVDITRSIKLNNYYNAK